MIIRKLRGNKKLLAIALAAGVAVSAVAGSAVIKSGKTEAQAATTDTSTSQTPPALPDGSTLTGAVTDDESNAGNGGNGYCNLYIDKTSKWVVTADSTLTNLYNAGTIVDASGNTVTIKGTDGTVYIKGTSSVTVTVGSYSTIKKVKCK